MKVIRALALMLAVLCFGIGVYAYMNPAEDNVQFLLQLSIFVLILITLLIFFYRRISKAG